jgi:TonB family protein
VPSKTRPYEQFGSYILFKKLEADSFGELWRAGRIDDRHLGPLVALRRLTGGDREALAQSAAEARAVAPLLTGTSFAKDQVIDVFNGTAFVAHDYGGGRSLRHIVDRARGGAGITPNPIPIDQAILIAEKVALSLATTAELKYDGHRLAHGALIPQFIWISDDGEVRVAGQQLGKGLIASLKDVKVAAAVGRYFSPEYQHSGEPTKGSEVFAMGAIFYLLVTGNEPPDAVHVSAFSQTVHAGKISTGQPVPEDIRAVLEKSLSIDPARRYESIADMKKALSALAHSGKYSATTFNLAFYLSTLLKKEVEGETLDREKESKVNIAPYLEHQLEISAPIPVAPTPATRAPLFVGAAVLLAIAIVTTAWWLMRGSRPATSQIASPTRPAASPPAKPPVVPQPIVATATGPAIATATLDPAAQKKAFEEAVNQKLQEEMLKMQTQFDKQLQQKKSKNAAVQSTPPVLTASVAPQRTNETMDDRSPSAAAFDERRVATRTETAASGQAAPAITQTQAPAPQPQPQQQVATPTPAQSPGVREGDVVKFDELDARPELITKPRVAYPPIAMRQRVESSVILTVLVSENGDVLDVNVLRGDPRYGFNEAAIRAIRGARYKPAMKDGKRVRTWVPQPIEFKLAQ